MLSLEVSESDGFIVPLFALVDRDDVIARILLAAPHPTEMIHKLD